MNGPLGEGDLPPASPPRGRHLRTDSNVSTDEYVRCRTRTGKRVVSRISRDAR